jgi:hypothetical protein
LARKMNWPLQGCPADELPLLALVRLLPLLVVPLLLVPLLEVPLPDPPEVEELAEVAELSEVAGLCEAGLWKGLLQMKGGLMEKRLPVVLLRKGEGIMPLGLL